MLSRSLESKLVLSKQACVPGEARTRQEMLNCTRQMCAVGVVMIMVTLTHGMETSTTRTTDAVTETGLGKLRAQTVPPPQGTGHSVREGADGHAENGKLRTKADERGEDSPAVSTPADTRTTQSMLSMSSKHTLRSLSATICC